MTVSEIQIENAHSTEALDPVESQGGLRHKLFVLGAIGGVAASLAGGNALFGQNDSVAEAESACAIEMENDFLALEQQGYEPTITEALFRQSVHDLEAAETTNEVATIFSNATQSLGVQTSVAKDPLTTEYYSFKPADASDSRVAAQQTLVAMLPFARDVLPALNIDSVMFVGEATQQRGDAPEFSGALRVGNTLLVNNELDAGGEQQIWEEAATGLLACEGFVSLANLEELNDPNFAGYGPLGEDYNHAASVPRGFVSHEAQASPEGDFGSIFAATIGGTNIVSDPYQQAKSLNVTNIANQIAPGLVDGLQEAHDQQGSLTVENVLDQDEGIVLTSTVDQMQDAFIPTENIVEMMGLESGYQDETLQATHVSGEEVSVAKLRYPNEVEDTVLWFFPDIPSERPELSAEDYARLIVDDVRSELAIARTVPDSDLVRAIQLSMDHDEEGFSHTTARLVQFTMGRL